MVFYLSSVGARAQVSFLLPNFDVTRTKPTEIKLHIACFGRGETVFKNFSRGFYSFLKSALNSFTNLLLIRSIVRLMVNRASERNFCMGYEGRYRGPQISLGTKFAHNSLFWFFCPKPDDEQKKKVFLKFSPIFCPKLGEGQNKKKKRSSLKLSPINTPLDASPTLNAETWTLPGPWVRTPEARVRCTPSRRPWWWMLYA